MAAILRLEIRKETRSKKKNEEKKTQGSTNWKLSRSLSSCTHTHTHTLRRLIMICIDHDDVLPTYERQLPSCPPSHKVNLQPDTGCALGGRRRQLKCAWAIQHTRRADTLAIHTNGPGGATCLSHQFTPCLFFLQDMLRGECDKKQSCHMCCVCVGNLHLLVNTCK